MDAGVRRPTCQHDRPRPCEARVSDIIGTNGIKGVGFSVFTRCTEFDLFPLTGAVLTSIAVTSLLCGDHWQHCSINLSDDMFGAFAGKCPRAAMGVLLIFNCMSVLQSRFTYRRRAQTDMMMTQYSHRGSCKRFICSKIDDRTLQITG